MKLTSPDRLEAAGVPRAGEVSVSLLPIETGEAIEDAGASAELTLLDPTPLFLPTAYNSGRVDVSVMTERSPGASFGDIEPKMVFPEGNSQLNVPDVVQVHRKPIDALEDLAPSIVLNELPRHDLELSRFPGRAGMIEVRRVLDGAVIWRQALDQSPPGASALTPIEMMVVVDSAGFVTVRGALGVAAAGEAAPVFGESQVDLMATSELLRVAALGRQLSAGIYRISLGP